MEQTTTTLVSDWKLVLALVAGSSFLTTIGIYVLARWTHAFRGRAAGPLTPLASPLSPMPGTSGQTASARQAISRQFTEVQMTCDRNFAMVMTFRKAIAAGMPTAKDVLLNDMSTFYESVLPKDMLEARGPQDRIPIRELIPELTAEMMAHEAQMAADSAALVFAHSILDDAASRYLRIAAALAPDDWEGALQDRKVSLSDYKSVGTYDAALQSALEKYLTELEGKALVARVNLLNQKCQPMPNDASRLHSYKLDLERIKTIDGKRHDIIHRLNLRESFQDLQGDIAYLHDTCRYLAALLTHRYGIVIDEKSMDAIVATFRPPQGSGPDLAIAEIIKKARE